VSRQRRHTKQTPPAPHKGLRRVHAVCAALVALAVASLLATLVSQAPPVPIAVVPRAVVLGASAGIFLLIVALICWLLKPTEDRITAGVTTLFTFGLTMGVTVPDLLYRINAWQSDTLAQTTVQERFVLLDEQSPGKHRHYFVLHTASGETSSRPAQNRAAVTQRHISRQQYEALQALFMPAGQPLQLNIVQGRLGWPYVQSAIRPADDKAPAKAQ
jgi:hypothetical protein